MKKIFIFLFMVIMLCSCTYIYVDDTYYSPRKTTPSINNNYHDTDYSNQYYNSTNSLYSPSFGFSYYSGLYNPYRLYLNISNDPFYYSDWRINDWYSYNSSSYYWNYNYLTYYRPWYWWNNYNYGYRNYHYGYDHHNYGYNYYGQHNYKSLYNPTQRRTIYGPQRVIGSSSYINRNSNLSNRQNNRVKSYTDPRSETRSSRDRSFYRAPQNNIQQRNVTPTQRYNFTPQRSVPNNTPQRNITPTPQRNYNSTPQRSAPPITPQRSYSAPSRTNHR